MQLPCSEHRQTQKHCEVVTRLEGLCFMLPGVYLQKLMRLVMLPESERERERERETERQRVLTAFWAERRKVPHCQGPQAVVGDRQVSG